MNGQTRYQILFKIIKQLTNNQVFEIFLSFPTEPFS